MMSQIDMLIKIQTEAALSATLKVAKLHAERAVLCKKVVELDKALIAAEKAERATKAKLTSVLQQKTGAQYPAVPISLPDNPVVGSCPVSSILSFPSFPSFSSFSSFSSYIPSLSSTTKIVLVHVALTGGMLFCIGKCINSNASTQLKQRTMTVVGRH